MVKALKSPSSSGTLSTPEITSIFELLQLLREERTNTLMKDSAEQQRTEAMESPFYKFVALTLLPMTDSADVLFSFSCNLLSAEKLDPSFELKRSFTGIACSDSYLTHLSAAFMPALAGWDKNYSTLHMYFLAMLNALIAIYAVESCRKRNAMNLVAM